MRLFPRRRTKVDDEIDVQRTEHDQALHESEHALQRAEAVLKEVRRVERALSKHRVKLE